MFVITQVILVEATVTLDIVVNSFRIYIFIIVTSVPSTPLDSPVS